MDSFEIKTDNFDPSRLRNSNEQSNPRQTNIPLTDIEKAALMSEEGTGLRPDITENVSTADHPTERAATPSRQASENESRENHSATTQPRPAATTAPSAATTATGQTAAKSNTPATVNLDDHKTIVGLTRFFTDNRLSIFFGVALILFSGLLLIAAISYISTASADQSIVINNVSGGIAANHEGVANSVGWFGALLSHLLLYRWLGLGAFIVIFYIGALGISLVRLHHFHFWQLTLKSLVAAIALSIIFGFVTYGMTTDTLWGGEHGYWINNIVISAASFWGAAALSILMATALVLIFIGPIRNAVSSLKKMIARRRAQLSTRYRESMAAAKAAMQQEKENREKPEEEPTTGSIDDQVLTPDPPEPEQQEEPKPQPQPQETPSRPFDPFAPADVDFFTSSTASPNSTESTESIAKEKPDPDTNPNQPLEPIALTEIEYASDTFPPVSELMPADEEPEKTDDSDEQKTTTADGIKIEITNSLSEDAPQQTENKPQQTVDEPEDESDDEEVIDEDEFDNTLFDPTAELSHYRFPGIELLHQRESTYVLTEEEQEENNHRIISTLDAYGIKIESIKATVGPTITLYEVVPQRGTRIASIKRLGDDMALSLSAIGIRIIAPIPGKGTIGMEVPNKNPQTVGIRSILSSAAYHQSDAQLPIAMGTTIDNRVYVTDLAKTPHLLVAGATGMGKSVGLNTIIASLLYKKHPAELKFVLVDPKMVEFSLYRTLEKHFLAKLPDEGSAVITDPTKVIATLNSLCLEMDDRYDLLAKANVREIKAYNQKFISRRLNPEKGHRYMPYIVVIIDEFADLIMTAGKEIEQPVARIAQKARAVGIHMILATQRPSVNVITGMIKANFPARMAFRVTQMNDSRTILDRPGAEQLIGRGDMLISRDGIIDRVQCAFIDTDEVENICNSISEQIGYSTAYILPDTPQASSDSAGGRGVIADRDPMFADAGRTVIEANMGSASLLQRKFNIGYPRAGKLIDQLEQAGVLGPQMGSGKPRAVLMDLYGFERYLESSDKK